MTEEIADMSDKKLTKTFKEYYEDPSYRARHKAYILAKVNCPACDVPVARCNMTKHKRTKKHEKAMSFQTELRAVYEAALRLLSKGNQL